MSDITIKSYGVSPEGRNKYGQYFSSANITKAVTKSVYGGNSTNEDLGNNNGNYNENAGSNFIITLSQSSDSWKGNELSLGPVTKSINVIGYKGVLKHPTFVGIVNDNYVFRGMDAEGNPIFIKSGTTAEYPENYGISGVPSGMTVEVTGNGLDETQIHFTITDAGCFIDGIQVYEGALQISCALWKSDFWGSTPEELAEMDDLILWQDAYSGGNVFVRTLEYKWKIDEAGSSSYKLDLSNEMASVNVDSAGTIYTASTLTLACTAQLYYGREEVSGAHYSIPSELAASGVTGHNVGNGFALSFDPLSFQWAGYNLPIVITATVGTASFSQTMTISKNYPGADGQDAVSRWIVLSADEIRYNINSSMFRTSAFTPTTISAYCMKQVGGNPPEPDTGNTIWYNVNSSAVSTYSAYTTTLNINTLAIAHNPIEYLSFGLKNSNNIFYEHETVPVLGDGKNGKDGQPGDPGPQGPQGAVGHEGRTGAAIRGPYDYETEISENPGRRFCSGKGEGEDPGYTYVEGDELWIDIMMRIENSASTYYMCIHSYNSTPYDNWNNVKGNWQSANTFDFIATKVLLADNAKIKFLTNNEIYLMNGNTIVGGGKGTNGDADHNGIIWWAGDTNNGVNLENAPWKVLYDGSMYATSGYFSASVQCPYYQITDTDVASYSSSYSRFTLNQDKKTYIVLYDTRQLYSETVYLPTPSASYNGVCYNFILPPTTRNDVQYWNIYSPKTGTRTNPIYDFTHYNDDSIPDAYDTIRARGGYLQLACIDLYGNGSYRWCIIRSTAWLAYVNGTVEIPISQVNSIVEIATGLPGADKATLYLVPVNDD